MGNIGVLLKIAEFLKLMWSTPHQVVRTIIVIIISALIAISVRSSSRTPYDPEPEQIYMDEVIVSEMKSSLIQLEDSAYITRIRYKQNENGDDVMVFKDALGFFGGQVQNLKEYNQLYCGLYHVDRNTSDYIRNLKSLQCVILSSAQARDMGYQTASGLLKGQNIVGERKVRIIVIKDDTGIVWLYTLSFADSDMVTDDYSSRYYHLGYEILYKLAAKEQERINMRKNGVLSDLLL